MEQAQASAGRYLDDAEPLEDEQDAELSIYYHRRFQRFSDELNEHIQKIQEYKEQQEKYRAALQEADVRRKNVEALQARLSEIDLQIEQDRLRVLSLRRENQDLELLDQEQQIQVKKLLAASPPPPSGLPAPPAPPGRKRAEKELTSDLDDPPGSEPIPEDGQVASSSSGLSKSVVRSVRVPHSGDDAIETRKAVLRRELEAEIEAHHTLLRDFAVERTESARKAEVETEAIRAEISAAINGLQQETEQFGDLIEGYAQAHFQHIALQRQYAEEVHTLKVCNEELTQSAEAVLSTAQRESAALEKRIIRDADQHVRYTRHLEAKDRKGAHAAYQSLEEVEGRTDAKMIELRKGIAVLKERCAKHRKVRHFALEGIRSDLSLLKQKLKVLEDVARQVDAHIQIPVARQSDFGETTRIRSRGKGPTQGTNAGRRVSRQRQRTPGAPYKASVVGLAR